MSLSQPPPLEDKEGAATTCCIRWWDEATLPPYLPDHPQPFLLLHLSPCSPTAWIYPRLAGSPVQPFIYPLGNHQHSANIPSVDRQPTLAAWNRAQDPGPPGPAASIHGLCSFIWPGVATAEQGRADTNQIPGLQSRYKTLPQKPNTRDFNNKLDFGSFMPFNSSWKLTSNFERSLSFSSQNSQVRIVITSLKSHITTLQAKTDQAAL